MKDPVTENILKVDRDPKGKKCRFIVNSFKEFYSFKTKIYLGGK